MLQKVNKVRKNLKIYHIYADRDIVRKFARKDKPFTMGMAASQGRLLFMTARISNNEFEQQCVANSKQRLADDSQQANDRYLEALQTTQYQILSGYNGDSPNYEPVTYNQLTSINSVATNKQYIVSDNKGQILVTDKIAKAFGNAHNDFNTFLRNLGGLTQVEKTTVTEADVHDAWDKYFASINKGHPEGIYYDKNLTSEHILGFSFHDTNASDGSHVYSVTYNTAYFVGGAGNKIYLQEDSNGQYKYANYLIEAESYIDENGETAYVAKYKPTDWLGSTNMMDEQGYIYIEQQYCFPFMDTDGTIKFKWCAGGAIEGDFDNYPTATTLYVDQDYMRFDTGSLNHPYINDKYLVTPESRHAGTTNLSNQTTIFYEGSTEEQRELYDYAMAVSEKYAKGSQLEYDADKVQYYKNIYQQMISNGFTTFDKMVNEKYINTISYDNGSGDPVGINNEDQAYKNDNWLITLLKNGKLSIAYYSSTEKDFVKTTLDDDESIVEKENKSKMAIAEQVYQTHMDRIEKEDKRFDMQLTRLESEHTALTTEYESVAKVISKNVEKSFSTFNA